MPRSFIKNVKERKERSVLFIKNAKERENIAFFSKERKRTQERCVLLKSLKVVPQNGQHFQKCTELFSKMGIIKPFFDQLCLSLYSLTRERNHDLSWLATSWLLHSWSSFLQGLASSSCAPEQWWISISFQFL